MLRTRDFSHREGAGQDPTPVAARPDARAPTSRLAARRARASRAVLAIAASAILQSPAGRADSPLPWMDRSLAPQERARRLVGAMTLAQKQQQLVGNTPEPVPGLPDCKGARHVRGIPELQIPTLRITNGPVGIGQNDCVSPGAPSHRLTLPTGEAVDMIPYSHVSSAQATALPSAIAVAASFDPGTAGLFGDVIATEASNLALHVFEAPGLNMARIPVLGRNFEYFGEDPYLTGVMTVAETRAVQAKGVIAMAKHYVANEQETNRTRIQENIDRRVLHQIYLLPFEMAVRDGDVASVMCSYNFVNGLQACETRELLSDVLRGQWGFEGYVQSDFFAVQSTAPSMLAGLDHLMPTPAQWSPERLDAALAAHELQVADLDRALLRRYAQMFRLGIFERQPLVQTPIDFVAGGKAARAIGVRSGVLLQNDNRVLPFDARAVRNVVLIGKATQVYAQQAVAGGVVVGKPMGGGGGSSDVVPNDTVSPLEGVKNVLAAQGNGAASVRLVTVADDNSDIDAALAAAAAADAVIIMAGTIAEEGADRASFADESGLAMTAVGDGLDWYVARPNSISTATSNTAASSNTVAMIKAILGAASRTARPLVAKTALVLKDNAGVAMDPALLGPGGPAILEVWFPGQEDGHIVADLLFGIENPSGKLPVTFPKAGQGFMDRVRSDPAIFPGVSNAAGQPEVTYKEGLNIGYRWYDSNAVEPAFPFGHGLSYTTFEISRLTVTPRIANGRDPLRVEFFVRNTGRREGAEVVQVYLGLPKALGEPPRRLVGFQKVWLASGEKKKIQIEIDPGASNHPLGYWDSAAQGWRVADGQHQIYVGNSSRNTVLSDSIRITGH